MNLPETLNSTRADSAFDVLQTAIVTGSLESGARIGEVELCRRFNITRGPLREAIRRLESRGLVVKKPHVGITVVTLGTRELIELYRIREALEGLAARQAAERMTAEDIADLRQLLVRHTENVAQADGQAYYQREGDFDFHYRIVTGSRNEKLGQMLLGDLYHLVRMYRYRLSTISGRPQRALREHGHIIDALEARDGELAEFLMQRHIRAARENIEREVANGNLTL